MQPKPIVLLGEALGTNEVIVGAPFVGTSGIELLKMLDEVGIIEFSAEDKSFLSRYYNEGKPELIDMIWRMHPEVYRTNVFNLHPPGNDLSEFCGPKAEAIPGYPPLVKGKGLIRAEFKPELERLADELVDLDPNLIICLGNSALWALTGKTGVMRLRGTTMESTLLATGFKLLPTYHPAAVLRQYELRATTIADLSKAKRESEYPEVRRPRRMIWIDPEIPDLETFYANYIIHSDLLSVDIETAGTAITCIGFAPSENVAIVIPFTDARKKTRSYWPTLEDEQKAWRFVHKVVTNPSIPKLYQNGLYDIAFKLRSMGLPTYGATEDTMLLHHSLQPEALKGLGYLGSLYCDEGAWKSMRKVDTIKRDE